MLKLYALKIALVEIDRNPDDTAPDPKDVLSGRIHMVGPTYARALVTQETAVADPAQLEAMFNTIRDEMANVVRDKGLPHVYAEALEKKRQEQVAADTTAEAEARRVKQTPVAEEVVSQQNEAEGKPLMDPASTEPAMGTVILDKDGKPLSLRSEGGLQAGTLAGTEQPAAQAAVSEAAGEVPKV